MCRCDNIRWFYWVEKFIIGKLTWLERIEVKKDKVRTNVFKNIYKTISDKILQMQRFSAFSIIISKVFLKTLVLTLSFLSSSQLWLA